ncbi:hypothetical protein D082_31610 [Synechocystis sp. PCC 6714]|nr:hypothetical protein D082_31610 [Synechocystis sp. PCC 6714]
MIDSIDSSKAQLGKWAVHKQTPTQMIVVCGQGPVLKLFTPRPGLVR